MSSGGTSDNVATRTFDSLIGDNSVSLVSSSSIPARVSSISGELVKFNYGHSMSGFFLLHVVSLAIPDASKRLKQVLQSRVTSVPMRFVHLPPACGSLERVRGSRFATLSIVSQYKASPGVRQPTLVSSSHTLFDPDATI